MASEDPTTPDLARLMRSQFDAINRRDLDTVMSLYAADAVLSGADAGFGTFVGVGAIRRAGTTQAGARPTSGRRRRRRARPRSTRGYWLPVVVAAAGTKASDTKVDQGSLPPGDREAAAGCSTMAKATPATAAQT